jgi:uncharacterized protein YceK
MKRSLLLILIITIILLISGCCSLFEGDEQVVRTYTHNASSNVTINIYKYPQHNLTILESNNSEIKVVESFSLKKSYVKESNKFIQDYVRFNGDNNNLSINISLASYVSGWETKDSNVHVNIYLPKSTNYSINYLSSII